MFKDRLRTWLGFIISLAIFTAFISYRAIAVSEIEQNWQPLSEMVTAEKLAEIIADNTAPSADREGIAASAIGYEQRDLLLVDFNTPDLCGIGGCALAGYRPSTGERVLTVYLQRTASDEPIVRVIDKAEFELPCLLVPPNTADDNIFAEVEREAFCYDGESWSVQ